MFRYYREHFHYSLIKAMYKTYSSHCIFAQVVIDKFAMYAGHKFDIEIEGYSNFLSLADGEKGFMQLSSHIGNYEIAGYSLVAKTKTFNALVFGGEKSSVMENRNKMFDKTNIKMIPINNDMSHLFIIEKALNDGEIVSMPADRIFGSSKYVSCNLLGKEARFPLGPFRVVTMKGLDVLAVNVMKTSLNGYKIYVTPLNYDKSATRSEQVSQLSHAYVSELEKHILQYPTQWFNYFEFWS